MCSYAGPCLVDLRGLKEIVGFLFVRGRIGKKINERAMCFVVEESVEAVGARREREQKKVDREKRMEWTSSSLHTHETDGED